MFVKILNYFAVILIFLNQNNILCNAQVSGPGTCPTINGVKNFELTKSIGIWWEQEKYFHLLQASLDCVKLTITPAGNNSVIMNSTGYNEILARRQSIFGVAKLVLDSDGNATSILDVSGLTNEEKFYNVIDVDYNSHLVLWTCKDGYFFNTQYMWIFTREQFPKEEVLNKIKKSLADMKMTTSSFVPTDQTKCYP